MPVHLPRGVHAHMLMFFFDNYLKFQNFVKIIYTMTKKLLPVILLFLFAIKTSAQSVCDSVSISPDTVYINQLTDVAAFVDVIYTGQNDISYSTCSFIFPDSSNIDINYFAVSNGIAGPFVFSAPNGYQIVYNNPAIPANTIVNAFFHIYHDANPFPAIDCQLPVTFIINSTTGLSEPVNTNRFSFFPNPVNRFLTIESTPGETELSIYDLPGKKLFSTVLRESKTTVDLSFLSRGIYMITTEKKNYKASKKLVIAAGD
jgi:hypothetical protein